jgi:RNA polymerase sigma-70 factor (ECF subfamily)
VDDHGDALFRYAVLRVRDRSLAEDLVQETFLAALKSHSEFKGQSELRTWMIGILRHKVVDHLRKSRPAPLPEVSEDSDPLIDGWFSPNGHWIKPPARFVVDPAALAENQEFWEVLRTCLQGIPGRAGEAFSMRIVSDVPANEVCKLLGVTPTNLWVQLHRARARLRACLEKNWFKTEPPVASRVGPKEQP